MTISDLAETFKTRLSRVIDPALCAGCKWLDEAVATNPDMTVEQQVAEIERKIAEGTADHGWLIAGLRFCWEDLTEYHTIGGTGRT